MDAVLRPHVSSCCSRCFFIAQSYVLVKKWSEALVLYERVLKYAKEVQAKAKNLNSTLKVARSALDEVRGQRSEVADCAAVSTGPPRCSGAHGGGQR